MSDDSAARPHLKLTINGELRTVAAGNSISQLLDELKLDSRYLAVEVNRQVIPRRFHGTTCLQPNDAVEIVTLVGGG